MRIYAILAHPKKDSLNGQIFYKTIQHLKDLGHEVDVLDLYERFKDVPFYLRPDSSGGLDQFPLYKEVKESMMTADRIFMVYPVYWYAVPGIMKCWLDLITNYAWKFKKGPYGIPLHNIKRGLVVNSASMSNWFRWLRTRNSGTEMIKESFKFFGINDYYFYEIGSTKKLTQEKVDKHQAKILKLANWLVD